jgi:hypothetical protein
MSAADLPRRHEVPPTVYVLLQGDISVTNVLAVFADLQDANHECLRQAQLAGVDLSSASSTMGPDTAHLTPVEPLRWDTPDGVSCWVEIFPVTPKRIVTTAMGTVPKR